MRAHLLMPLLLLLACGGAEEDPPAASGDVALEATTDPSPPHVGQNRMRIAVDDGGGTPVSGATLTVSPWMPHHGHGSTETAQIVEEAAGVYVASPVTFQMPGRWEVEVVVRRGDLHAERTFTYDVK